MLAASNVAAGVRDKIVDRGISFFTRRSFASSEFSDNPSRRGSATVFLYGSIGGSCGLTPSGLVTDPRVENGRQFSHTGHQGHFSRFTLGSQSRVQRPDDRIVTARNSGSHVQRATHIGPPTPAESPAVALAAVTIQRCDANQGRDLPAIEPAQFG